MESLIPTKILVLSDTHGAKSLPRPINETVNSAIHCGDLTEESKLDEFRATIDLLKTIRAPLKLVIAGNHDWTLDTPMFSKKLAEANLCEGEDAVRREYGAFGEARKVLDAASDAGVVFLDEGTHRFELANGAKLTVYASPYTPPQTTGASNMIPNIVRTHGPPHGILDYTSLRQRAGSPSLFAAVCRARPQLHCFGHIHRSWGAKRVAWRDEMSDKPSHFTSIDNDGSEVIESLAALRPNEIDTEEIVEEKKRRREENAARGYCWAAPASAQRAEGSRTLFVNAAIQTEEEGMEQLPWMVEIALPRSDA